MKHKNTLLLCALTAATSATAATTEATLRIDTTTTYQKVVGFGGFAFSAQWGCNLSDAEITTMFGKGNTQLGYNVMRARISPTEYASWGYDCWGTTAAVIKKCKDLGCLAFASAWTPPGEYTSNGENTHGHILPERFGDYATFLNRFIDRVVACGTDVDYISLQNEPDWEPDYEGCVWNAKDFIDFYANYGTSVNRPLIGPESLATRRALSDSILNDAAACAHLGILGGHLYGGGNFDYPLARQKGKQVWMTEYLIDKASDDNSNYDWSDALTFARVVNTSMLANMNAWCHYALKSSYGMMGDGTRGTTDAVVTKRGYALSHFAKYVTGTTRVKHELNNPDHNLTVSAYRSTTGDSIVIMVINTGSSSCNLTIDLPFCCKSGQKILTRPSSNMTKSTLSFTESCTPTLSVAASCIETFVLKKSSNRTSPQTEVAAPVFADDFAAYNGEPMLPMGWKVTYAGKAYTASNKVYSFWDNNPNLWYYSPESPIRAGLPLRATSSSASGTLTYGAVSGYTLPLQPGNYRLTYYAIGWKGAQKLYCYVNKSGSTTNIASHSGVDVSENIGGLWGTQYDTFQATPDTLTFTVTQSGNYLLNWKVTYYAQNAIDGACQALVGGIKVENLDIPNAIETLHDDNATSIVKTEYFDLNGRSYTSRHNGIVLQRDTYANGNVRTHKMMLP